MIRAFCNASGATLNTRQFLVLIGLALSVVAIGGTVPANAGSLTITNVDHGEYLTPDGFNIANGKILYMVKGCQDGKMIGFAWNMASPNGTGKFTCDDSGLNTITYRTSGRITERGWLLTATGTWTMRGGLSANMTVDLKLAIDLQGSNCRVKSFVYIWGPGPLGDEMNKSRSTPRSKCVLKL